MDTKWKRFSRSYVLRFLLNVLLIASLVGCVVCIAVAHANYEMYSKKINHYSVDYLFGNKEIVHALDDAVKNTLSVAVDNAVEENMGKKKSVERLSKKLSSDDFNLYISYTTKDQKEVVLANGDYDKNSLKDQPLYVSYTGSKGSKDYKREWKNYCKDFETDFAWALADYNCEFSDLNNFHWLSSDDILAELCQQDYKKATAIAKEMTKNIELYKENVRNLLFYIRDEKPSGFYEIENSTLQKLYDEADGEIYRLEQNDRVVVNNGKIYYNYDEVDLDELVLSDDQFSELFDEIIYDSNYGLYYCESDNSFLDVSKDRWYTVNEVVQMEKEGKLEKPEQYTFKQGKLTEKELETIEKNIAQAIYQGHQDVDDDELEALNLSIPFAALLGTPENYEIYVGMKDTSYSETQGVYINKLKKDYKHSQDYRKYAQRMEKLSLLWLVVAVIWFVMLAILCGRKAGTKEVQLLFFDRWFTGIEIVLILVIGVVTIGISDSTLSYGYVSNKEGYIIGILGAIIGMYTVIQLILSLIRKCKAKIFWKTTLIGKWIAREKEALPVGPLGKKITLYAILFVFALTVFNVVYAVAAVWVIDGISDYLMSDSKTALFIVGFISLWVYAVIAILVGCIARSFAKKLEIIRDGVKKIKAGDLEYQLPAASMGVFQSFANDVNTLADGLENAVEEMVKSERLKTELISNVSHDIKTPLTSIITYVDLLKREDLQPEKAKEYVEVLDQKSQRLKALTEDLFEAAKATSGAMKTEPMRMDIGALMDQAIGEYSEKLEKSDLDVRNTIEKEAMFVYADGRLVWRIVENLLNNAAKYAMPGSRVYIDARQVEDKVEVIVKNISGTELNISAEELMERFTRGDRSRNTEGSGLGLNIAMSLAKLQKGSFHVEIDGDLFKAILQLPIA